MTTRTSRLAPLAVTLIVACTQPGDAPSADAADSPAAQQPAAATQADTAAINELRQQEVTAVSTGDTTLAYMDENIVIMSPGQPVVIGLPAARTWLKDFLRQFRASVSYGNTTVMFAGDLAVEQYTGTLNLTPVAGGQPMTEPLKGLHVYRRGAGGWKMIYDVWNSDAVPHAEHPPQR
jgi:ketosteroid isomerase-like protein